MAEAKLKVTAEGVNEASAALGRMGDKMQGVSTTATKVGSAFTVMRGLIASAAVYGVGRFIVDSVKMADSAAKATRGFQSLGGTRKILEDAREAIGGVADESDLAAAATQAMRANSGLAAKDFVTLAKFAKFAADQTGGDFAGSLQEVNAAMVSGRPIMLRRLGLMVDLEKAEKEWARANNRSAGSLTAMEKAAIHSNAALEGMRSKLPTGPTGGGPGDALSRAGAAWKSGRERLGEVMGDPVENLAVGFAAMMGDKGAKKRSAEINSRDWGTAVDWAKDLFSVERSRGPISASSGSRTAGMGIGNIGFKIFADEIRVRAAGG
jgi:hypothetical protein